MLLSAFVSSHVLKQISSASNESIHLIKAADAALPLQVLNHHYMAVMKLERLNAIIIDGVGTS